MLPDWTALPVGILIATLATAIGLGGGVLWAPYLILVAGLDPNKAVFTSLLIQTAGMSSGAITSIVKKKADIKVAFLFAGSAIPGVIFGALLSGYAKPSSIIFLLGVAALATALIFVVAREDYDFTPITNLKLATVFRYLWITPILSILTGLVSVGVGDFLIPILRNRLGLKMDSAIGLCLIVMALNALTASTARISMGAEAPWELVFWAIIGVLIGGQVGPRVSSLIPDQTLKEVFIYLLTLVGIHILFRA